MIFQDLKERFLAETPIFWKKVQRIAAGIATIGVTFVGLPIDVPTIKTIGGYFIAVGSIVATLSQLTVNTNWTYEENVG